MTSEKIRLQIEALFNERHKGKYRTASGTWKRKWKRRLPESRGWIRGYQGWAHGPSPNNSKLEFWAVAVANEADTELKQVYLVDDADEECKKLGVLEVMFKDD